MVVVTALPRTYAEMELEITNLRIKVLVAYHDTRRHRPDPEPVTRAVETVLADIIGGRGAGAFK